MMSLVITLWAWLQFDSAHSFTGVLQLINEVLPHLPDFPRGESHDLSLLSCDLSILSCDPGLAYLHHLVGSSPEVLTFMPRLRL